MNRRLIQGVPLLKSKTAGTQHPRDASRYEEVRKMDE